MSSEPALTLPQGRLAGRSALAETVRTALQVAAAQGWQELILCDADFAAWPLGERAVVQALQAWARSGRHCLLLALDYSSLARRHARFVQWRQTWSHLIDCRQCRGADPLAFPSVIWSPAWVMQRIDVERDVLVCDSDAARRIQLRQVLDECRRDSTPGFPATVLGL